MINIKKYLKIIIIIIMVYLIGGFLFWIYSGFSNKNEVYENKLFAYTTNKICYECSHGLKGGMCPKIRNNENLSYAKYPNAKEYKDSTEYLKIKDMINSSGMISEELMTKSIECESRFWDFEKNYYNSLKKPTNTIFFSLKEQFEDSWMNYFIFPGFLIYLVTCGITNGYGCSM